MFTISKEFHFSASHILSDLPPGHQCGRLHGHNYILKVFLQSEQLDQVGFVQDYGELKEIQEFVNDHLDHRHLNDILRTINPTSENICEWLFNKFRRVYPKLIAIELSETPKTNCRYEQSKNYFQ